MAAGSLLVAGSALAAQHLFRVEQSWFNKPNPIVTTAGGAGMYQAYIQPYVTVTMMGCTANCGYYYPGKYATVQAGNPIGGAFTLPQSAWSYSGSFSITPKTGWAGYTTITVSNYYNGPGHFKADNVHTTSTPSRIVFPTTNGNPYPNLAAGNPVTASATHSGYYDFGRVGSINVTPGPRRFGGTLRVFYRPTAFWYQYVTYFTPALYKGYAYFQNVNNGVTQTPNSWVSNIGDHTEIYRLTRFLLNVKGSGTGDHLQSATAKATTPTTAFGIQPTVNGGLQGGGGTPNGGPASYITGVQQYVNTIHPWTTGYARVNNPIGSPSIISPRSTGYDTSLGGVDLQVDHFDWNQQWNKTAFDPCPASPATCGTLTTTTYTWAQHLYGVRRVVSMVRPRLIHTYSVPLDPTTDPITETWPVSRLWRLKVYFVPEPAGMLLLGTGIVALLGVSRIRRR